MNTLAWIVFSTGLISLFALVGVFTLALKKESFQKILLALVAFSAGTLMGDAFLHLLPEAFEPGYLLIGFVFYFALEKVFLWHHCRDLNCDEKPFALLNLFGDVLHNFVDGLVIAASFLVDIRLGLVTSLVVTLHEIPQEIGDYSILIYAGYSRAKALLANFAVALTGVLGGLLGFFLGGRVVGTVDFLLAFTAGCFLYLSATDLVPEIKKGHQAKKSIINFLCFGLGLLLMYGLTFLPGE